MRPLPACYLAFTLWVAGAATAAPGSHLVADPRTSIAGLSGTLSDFGLPAFNGQVVAFSAKRGTMAGIYAGYFSGSPEVHKVVELSDPTPDGNTYIGIAGPAAASASGGQAVAFWAQTSGGYRMYRSPGSIASVSLLGGGGSYSAEPDSMVTVATGVLNTDTAGAGIFANGTPGRAVVSGLVFPAFTYSEAGIGNTTEAVGGPGGLGFAGVSFAAHGESGFRVLVDTNTTVPGTTEKFRRYRQPAVDGLGNIVFYGEGATRKGIYRYNGGPVATIVDSTMTTPQGEGRFKEFFGVALDDGATIFVAQPEFGAYRLYRSDSAGLRRLYADGDAVAFDDGVSRKISIDNAVFRPASIANHRLAIRTRLVQDNDPLVIVLLDVSASGDGTQTPPESGSSKRSGCGNGSAAAAFLPLVLATRWRRRNGPPRLARRRDA